MPKLPPTDKPDYSLRRRFFSEVGQPLEWIDYGRGKFIDLATVQAQIRVLASVSRKVEIEFIKNGVRLGYDGEPRETNMIYEKTRR